MTYDDYAALENPATWPYSDQTSVATSTLTLQQVIGYRFSPGASWGNATTYDPAYWPALFGETGSVGAGVADALRVDAGGIPDWMTVSSFPGIGAGTDITADCANDPAAPLPVGSGSYYGTGWWLMVAQFRAPDGGLWEGATVVNYLAF